MANYSYVPQPGYTWSNGHHVLEGLALMLPYHLDEQIFQVGFSRGKTDIVQAGLLQAPGQDPWAAARSATVSIRRSPIASTWRTRGLPREPAGGPQIRGPGLQQLALKGALQGLGGIHHQELALVDQTHPVGPLGLIHVSGG